MKSKYCPKCYKIFTKGDTVRLSSKGIECCNVCNDLQYLQSGLVKKL